MFVVGNVMEVNSPDGVWEDSGHGAVLLNRRLGLVGFDWR